MNDKVISLLGLAERAGKIASGEFAAEKAVKTGKARLIIVAEDASDNTKKKFSDMCKYYHADLIHDKIDDFKDEIKEYYEQEEDILSYAQFGQVAVKFFQKRRDKKYNLDGKHEDFESKVHPV